LNDIRLSQPGDKSGSLAHTHALSHTYINRYIHTHMKAHTCIRSQTHTHTHTLIHTNNTHIRTLTHIHIKTFIRTLARTRIYTFKHTHKNLIERKDLVHQRDISSGGVVKVKIYEVDTKIELKVDTFLLGL